VSQLQPEWWGWHVNGNCLEEKQLPEHIHFSTDRVSFESIIRLPIEQFGIVPNSPSEIWRPMLTESERLFKEIAYRPSRVQLAEERPNPANC
jgi:hypothetical protein